jgi:hypothetical protein
MTINQINIAIILSIQSIIIVIKKIHSILLIINKKEKKKKRKKKYILLHNMTLIRKGLIQNLTIRKQMVSQVL